MQVGSRAAFMLLCCPLPKSAMLFCSDIFLSTHKRAQRLWNADAPVGLLVGLEQRNQDAWRGDGGVVECMHELDLAFLVAIANIHTTGLPVVEVRTRMRLAITALARYP